MNKEYVGMKNYSKSIDLWSVGCCFAEMLMGKAPLFKGDIEERQIQIICEIMGTPTEHNFPGVTKLPRYNLLKKKCSFTLDKILADYVGYVYYIYIHIYIYILVKMMRA